MSTCRIGVLVAGARSPSPARPAGAPAHRPAPGLAGEQVHLGRERQVLGARRDGALELDERGGGPGLEVEQRRRAPGRRRPGRRAPRPPRSRRRPAARRASSWVKRRPARPWPAGAPGSVEQRAGLGEVTGHGARDDRGVALGDEQAEVPPGRSTCRIVASAAAGSSTTSSTPWHSTTSALSAPTTSSRLDEVALPAGDLHPELARAAGERGQRVGAGVDDGDAVAELGHPHGEAAGAAADVEHVERPARSRPPARGRPTPRRSARRPALAGPVAGAGSGAAWPHPGRSAPPPGAAPAARGRPRCTRPTSIPTAATPGALTHEVLAQGACGTRPSAARPRRGTGRRRGPGRRPRAR